MPAQRRDGTDEVPLQVTVPRRIKHELDVRAAQTGPNQADDRSGSVALHRV